MYQDPAAWHGLAGLLAELPPAAAAPVPDATDQAP